MSLQAYYEKKDKDLYVDSTRIHPNRLLRCSPHLHRELELIIYYGGNSIAYCDSVSYQLSAGDVFLTFPNQIHSYETFTEEDYSIFIVKPDLMPELKDVFNLTVPVSAVGHGLANDPVIKFLGDRLLESRIDHENHRDKPHGKAFLRGYLLALFTEILRKMPTKGVSVGDSDTLRTIVAYCSNNFSANISLSVLENNLHLNRFYISHLFSDRLGIRFNDYINSLRVSEACRYLLHSEHNITEICDLVGFNTLRTFNRAFIRQLGVTPSEYRKANLQDKSVSAGGRKPDREGVLL